ncbi:hypothetical protein OsJ_34001 [Oryza sativa Japonica Group]|uniref:Uncharacterized protein n=1 Tax=Oryza sativa subsp. japonica TaxID=39947 RepID=A3CBL2_ORYSJ|nr:hypothetical protein OsJ_34001 [Oryza sativa Japonica Group]
MTSNGDDQFCFWVFIPPNPSQNQPYTKRQMLIGISACQLMFTMVLNRWFCLGDRSTARIADQQEEEEEEAEDKEDGGAGAITGMILTGAQLVGVVGGFGAAGYVYKDQINTFLTQFSGFIDGNS